MAPTFEQVMDRDYGLRPTPSNAANNTPTSQIDEDLLTEVLDLVDACIAEQTLKTHQQALAKVKGRLSAMIYAQAAKDPALRDPSQLRAQIVPLIKLLTAV
jgi:hypothetical protein